MAEFKRALAYTLKHEGGWSDDPLDPGGATNFGITFTTAQRHGIRNKDALRTITQEKVAAIYLTDYWRFDGITDQRVATKIFDMSVNMGLGTATRLLQGALYKYGVDMLAVDGIYGNLTEMAVNSLEPEKVLGFLCDASEEYYRAIAKRRPSSGKFLSGWLKRARVVPDG